MGTRLRVYVASPLGFAESTRAYGSAVSEALRDAGFEPLDPWEGSEGQFAEAFAAAEEARGPEERQRELERIDLAIGRHNHDLLQQADAVLAVLDGTDVDSGTAAEVGFAAACRLPVVGLRSDKRQAGENDGCSVNLQVEYFVRLNGGAITSSLEEAVGQLRLVGERLRPSGAELR
jgi:nucleoside 2-deoxyribosyltransferase